MRTLPRGVVVFLIGAALTGCIAGNNHTNKSSGDKRTDAKKQTDAKPQTDAKKPAPNISGIDADGKKFQLSDYRGKVVLLDFWASY